MESYSLKYAPKEKLFSCTLSFGIHFLFSSCLTWHDNWSPYSPFLRLVDIYQYNSGNIYNFFAIHALVGIGWNWQRLCILPISSLKIYNNFSSYYPKKRTDKEVKLYVILQVLVIKKRFDRNMKELHLCHLKSPKVGDFGLSRLWECLNYNYHYSNTGNEMSYYALSV